MKSAEGFFSFTLSGILIVFVFISIYQFFCIHFQNAFRSPWLKVWLYIGPKHFHISTSFLEPMSQSKINLNTNQLWVYGNHFPSNKGTCPSMQNRLRQICTSPQPIGEFQPNLTYDIIRLNVFKNEKPWVFVRGNHNYNVHFGCCRPMDFLLIELCG
jgi:hypothetical protein